jgi:hypothetical protein
MWLSICRPSFNVIITQPLGATVIYLSALQTMMRSDLAESAASFCSLLPTVCARFRARFSMVGSVPEILKIGLRF